MIYELPTSMNIWTKITKEFVEANNIRDNNTDYWLDEFNQYLRENYQAEYWVRDDQLGGDCFIFRAVSDYTFFLLKFS